MDSTLTAHRSLTAKHRALATVLIAIAFVMLLLGLAGCKERRRAADTRGDTVKVNGLPLPVLKDADLYPSIETFKGQSIRMFPGQHSSYGVWMTAMYNSAGKDGLRIELTPGDYQVRTPIWMSPYSQIVGSVKLDHWALHDPVAVIYAGPAFRVSLIFPTHNNLIKGLYFDGGYRYERQDDYIDTLAHKVTAVVELP